MGDAGSAAAPVPSRPERFHFVGVCGTGMAGVAAMLKELGHTVTGSDENVYPPMSDILAEAGVAVLPFDAGNLPGPEGCVVLGAGVSRRNVEAVAAVERGLPVLSYPAALARFVLGGRRTSVVAGTHGKTTTASMLAFILDIAGLEPGFLIGGVPKNFGRGARLPRRAAMVLEGDEYKSSNLDPEPKFLNFAPHLGVVTNIEFDHADMFPDMDAIVAAFRAFAATIRADGALVTSAPEETAAGLAEAARCACVRVGRDDRADWRLTTAEAAGRRLVALEARAGGSAPIGPFVLAVPGRHNEDNAALAAVAARLSGVDDAAIVRGLGAFAGVKRRLDVVAERNGVRVIDDFAHHPSEVGASIAALKRQNPSRRVWAIFEPRSMTSRRPLFQDLYREALSGADRVTVATVTPWAEGAATLDSERLAAALRAGGMPASAAPAVPAIVEEAALDLAPGTDLLVMSSGPFGGLVAKLRALIDGA